MQTDFPTHLGGTTIVPARALSGELEPGSGIPTQDNRGDKDK